jgi:hypothetical protein
MAAPSFLDRRAQAPHGAREAGARNHCRRPRSKQGQDNRFPAPLGIANTAEKIGELATLIDSIAEQSRLLTLDRNIESIYRATRHTGSPAGLPCFQICPVFK